MRYILFFWALPMGFIWSWYFLSLNDINFGMFFFSRVVHDAVFEVYGQMLGLEPEKIPMLIAEACVLDTAIIGGLFAIRRRRQLIEYGRQLKARYLGEDQPESA